MKRWIRHIFERLDAAHPLLARIVRFLLAGTIGTATSLTGLYVFTDALHFWYVFSSVIAFIAAFGVSFVSQKYWTFKDSSSDNVARQGTEYFGMSIINLVLNTSLVYAFTEHGHIHYLYSQIMASAIIAVESYFVYRYIIFPDKKHS